MNHAEKCPVCEGKGTIEKDVGHGISHEDLPCHGCNGKGWVTVEDQDWYYHPTWTWTRSIAVPEDMAPTTN